MKHSPCANEKGTRFIKTLVLFITSVLLLSSQSVFAASVEEEVRFVATVKQAFAKHDANALAALTCWIRCRTNSRKMAASNMRE